MADTAVEITTGTGTNIDTRTEATNGNHRQVIVVGDPSTNAGVAPVDATAGLKVDLGADNDVTMATLPDTAAGDLAALVVDTGTIAGDTTSIDGKITACDTTNLATAAKQGIAGTDLVGGAGAVAAGVQRITLASDDPAVTKLGTIDADTGSIATDTSTIAGDTTSIDGKITACDTGAVTVAASALPTGAATAAKQGIAGTDLVGGAGAVAAGVQRVTLASDDPAVAKLGTIDTDTSALAGAVSGTEVQVDVVASLPAGTNAIGKLSANSGVDIGDVDITSIAAGDNNIGNVDLASAIPAGTNAIGKLLPPDIDVTAHTNYIRKYYTSAGAATDGIIWSPAAGKRWHVVAIYYNISADATITIEDDKAGGDDPVIKGEFKAGSGMFGPFDPMYPLASGEDEADLTITTTAGNVYVTVVGYEV